MDTERSESNAVAEDEVEHDEEEELKENHVCSQTLSKQLFPWAWVVTRG